MERETSSRWYSIILYLREGEGEGGGEAGDVERVGPDPLVLGEQVAVGAEHRAAVPGGEGEGEGVDEDEDEDEGEGEGEG